MNKKLNKNELIAFYACYSPEIPDWYSSDDLAREIEKIRLGQDAIFKVKVLTEKNAHLAFVDMLTVLGQIGV